jgi:hypothetical protein
MAKTVFVLGAGASYGDSLKEKKDPGDLSQNGRDEVVSIANPPLIHNFFDSRFLYAEPETVERTNWRTIGYIRNRWGIQDAFGDTQWRSISLEAVFSGLAIENEFSPSGTDQNAQTQLALNDLKNYIRKIIGHSTGFRHGEYTTACRESK